jgi:hypothetical protein
MKGNYMIGKNKLFDDRIKKHIYQLTQVYFDDVLSSVSLSVSAIKSRRNSIFSSEDVSLYTLLSFITFDLIWRSPLTTVSKI